jgi:hypothetical protein
MRLIKLNADYSTFSLVERVGNGIPPYLTLSHTWGKDEDEVTFKDIQKGRGLEKSGNKKIDFYARQAKAHNLHHFWLNTCCIDKSSSAELSEAINSMFRWYRNSAVFVVWMWDHAVRLETSTGELVHDWGTGGVASERRGGSLGDG